MRYLASLLFLALAATSACTVGDDRARDDDTVWLTIGADAVGAVNQAMDMGMIDGTFQAADQAGQVSVLEISSEQLADLTRLMHDQFHRCGGYIAHDSLKSAVTALNNERADIAATQQLVNYTIDNATAVQALLPTLDQQNLVSVISHLSTAYTNRYHSYQGGTDAAMWLRDTWQGYIDASGRTDASVQLVQHSSTNQPSVVLTIQGDTLPDEYVIIGGHLDSTAGWSPGPSTSAPGADDDASGVATVSEVARTVLTQGFYPDRTLQFMAYAAEEVGLRGSGEIAADYSAQGINVVGVMQLDMTNYQGSNEDIVLMDDYTNAPQNAFIGDLIDTYLGLVWTYSTCGYGCSDHASWHNEGFPASIPFESRFNDYNPNIHTAADTLANSDPSGDHAMKFAHVALAYIAELAKGDFTDDPGPDPDPDPDPDPTQPTTETFSDSVARQENKFYGPFSVEPATTFEAVITGTGDADLYVNFGAQPTVSTYDCRPYKNGSNETCTLTVPAGETEAYIMIRGYQAASYTLTVTYTPNSGGGGGGGGGPTPATETFSGSVSQGQETHYGPFSVASGTSFEAAMTGSGDGDLYVNFGAPPTTTSYDCRPYLGSSNETCTLSVPAGETQAYVMVRGYSSATYNLTVDYFTP